MTTQRVFWGSVLLACAAAAQADATFTTQTDGKASFINVGGEGVSKFKGNRLRADQTVGGRVMTTIIDVDGRRFIDLDEKKKSANVTSLDSIAETLQKANLGNLQVDIAKTSQTKTVAGHACTVHNVKVSMPFNPTGDAAMAMTMVLSGTVCLSASAPGVADYQNFYRAAADSGFIFGDPRAAKSPTGAAQAKAYAAYMRKMVESGVALESHININATGSGPLAGMMGKLAASEIHTTVTKIETGSLPAEAFDVPPGFKVKNQK